MWLWSLMLYDNLVPSALFWIRRGCSWLTTSGKSESGPERLRSSDGFHKCDGLPGLIPNIVAPAANGCVFGKRASFFMSGFSKATKQPTSRCSWLPMGCPQVLWLLTIKPRHGPAWGVNLMQVPCSQHCLNCKEEDIAINVDVLAQMQNLHLSELTQGTPCDSLRMVTCLYSIRSRTSSPPPGNERADPVWGWSIRFALLLTGLQIPTLILFTRTWTAICIVERDLCTLLLCFVFVCLFVYRTVVSSFCFYTFKKICSGLTCLQLCIILKQCIQLLQLEPNGGKKRLTVHGAHSI